MLERHACRGISHVVKGAHFPRHKQPICVLYVVRVESFNLFKARTKRPTCRRAVDIHRQLWLAARRRVAGEQVRHGQPAVGISETRPRSQLDTYDRGLAATRYITTIDQLWPVTLGLQAVLIFHASTSGTHVRLVAGDTHVFEVQ